jgi:diaminohydroxyphosphoribosylaminopyrimidine deaminase/5-amino-6-(5-phosphoribosylamino)uracil reductase
MQVALAMARRGLGTTAPNPAVGTVIVEPAGDVLIARGWTQPGGRPHAETEALARAGLAARGATMYVTLEPCSHHGRTPPCADAIIAAGIARLVAAIEDPDPRVSGRGLDRLVAAGIAVERLVLARDADWVTRGHILRVTERRPFVQLKMALDGSGELRAGTGGQPTWVTGREARAAGHLLRSEADAILVGGRTVADDDPELTCRLPGAGHRSPVRVIACGPALIAETSRLVRSAREVPLWLAHGPDGDPTRLAALKALGAEAIPVPRVGSGLWLPALMEALVERGITRLLVEGGPRLWRAFAASGLADEVVAYIAGAASHPATIRQSWPALIGRRIAAQGLRLTTLRAVGDDLELTLARPVPARPARPEASLKETGR